MNEEMMNEVIETEDVNVGELDIYEEEKSGNGLLKLAVVSIGAIGAASAYLYKNRNKLKAKKEAKMIKKLRESGYQVYEAEIIEDNNDSDVNDENEN